MIIKHATIIVVFNLYTLHKADLTGPVKYFELRVINFIDKIYSTYKSKQLKQLQINNSAGIISLLILPKRLLACLFTNIADKINAVTRLRNIKSLF